MTRTPRLSVRARDVFERTARTLTYSIDRLARDLGVTAGTLFNYRKGRTRATGAALRRLAKALQRQTRLLERRYREVMRLNR